VVKLSNTIDGGTGFPKTSLFELDTMSITDNLDELKMEEGGDSGMQGGAGGVETGS
jgi:hypothetical protein